MIYIAYMYSGFYQKVRVFWHELGHFVAQQYNQKWYGGKGTEHLVIKRVETKNQNYDYEGGTKHKNSDEKTLLEHPASTIASAAYGCIFQSIKYGDPLALCLAPRGRGLHGHHDFESIMWVIGKQFNALHLRTPILICIEQYFKEIKDNPEFQDLFNTDILDLIESEDEVLYIDLEDLSNRVSIFFFQHEIRYKEFVNRLAAILSTVKPEAI